MPRARKLKPMPKANSIVSFDFENRTYQIDPDMKKVYRRFVEIETSKACQILSTWRASYAVA